MTCALCTSQYRMKLDRSRKNKSALRKIKTPVTNGRLK